MKLIATIIDTTGIQPYIFGSNRLRENVGASYLVVQATTTWVKEVLKTTPTDEEPLAGLGIADPFLPIETSGQEAEIIYLGGGNAVLLFTSKKIATKFIRILSTRVLREARGINLVATHQGFDLGKGSLAETIDTMLNVDLDRKKRSRTPLSPLLGLGVTQACRSTQLVAVDNSKHYGPGGGYPISREIAQKLDVVHSKPELDGKNLATQTLKQTIFDTTIPNQWKIPLDFDDFGRSKGEMSYIAVVHIDGNSMGDRFRQHGQGKGDREYINAIRALSDSVKEAGKNSLRQLTTELVEAMPRLQQKFRETGESTLQDNRLPFRPLVYGGDDVTFVCDGRLGLTLAARYLQLFEQQSVSDGKPLTACAGICIVKAHYPFARAYALSEELCQSAKQVAKSARKTSTEREQKCSALDWHIATSGLMGSLSDIRKREYGTASGQLEMRPLLLSTASDQSDWRTWDCFEHVINVFETSVWKGKRNKIMALRDILRQGPEKTKEFLTAYRLEHLPYYPEHWMEQPTGQDLSNKGWLNQVCGYFDAIEAIDYYQPFEGENQL
ncbi:MAG: hypothetical protein AAGD25_39875 [Cyanobacteria bacterium P01_F01_bin.150]